MEKTQKIFGTGGLVFMDFVPPALGAVLNLGREISATNKTLRIMTNAEALLIPQCSIKEWALQNSLFLSQ